MKNMDKEVERDDGDRMGRQTRLGLAVIGLLLLALVVVLAVKITGSDERAVASGTKKRAGRAASASTETRTGKLDRTWGKRKYPAGTLAKPTIAPAKSGTSATTRSNRWSLASDGRQSASSASEGSDCSAVALMPSPSGSTEIAANTTPTSSQDYAAWRQQTDSAGQARQSRNLPDPFNRTTGRADNTTSYPDYYASSSGRHQTSRYQTSPSPYPSYRSGSSSDHSGSTARSNPYRPTSETGRYGSSPYAASSQQDYAETDRRLGTSRSSDRYQYEQAPYSQKVAGPYSIRNRVSGRSPAGSSRDYYGSSSYNRDRYGTGSLGSYGNLGGLQEDGKYVVAPGDNFWTISRRLYGTGAYFQALAEWNRVRFPDENELRVGDVVLAPGQSELEDRYPDLCPSPERRTVMRSRMSAVSTPTRYHAGPVYQVQEGDTLYDIARFKLGYGARWPEIYDLNQDILQGDFDYLTPGMELALPEQPSDAVTQRPASERAR